jgi:hypothetical protein
MWFKAFPFLKLVYIGQSASGTGGRLFKHFTDEEKLEAINEDSDVVVLTFSEEESSLVCALESYLIKSCSPLLNKVGL